MMYQKQGLTDSVSCAMMEIPGRRIEQKSQVIYPKQNDGLVIYSPRQNIYRQWPF